MTEQDKSFIAAVEDLGSHSAAQLYKMMKAAHIKGRPHTTYRCPMAKYLDAACNITTNQVGVGKKYIVRRYLAKGKTRNLRVKTPASVATFLVNFDLGKYPDLFATVPRALKAAKTKKDKRKGDRHRNGYNSEATRRKRIVKKDIVGMLGGRGHLVG